MLTFEDFKPGASFGSRTICLDEDILSPWLAIFPNDRAHLPQMPPALMLPIMMRAYLALVAPRPPGNIHGSQWIRIHKRPQLGDAVVTEVGCMDKEMRGGRRWVTLSTQSRSAGGDLLFEGRKRLVWAA